jgi:hypothetical protein
MIIRVTKTRNHARFSDVVHIEFGIDRCGNSDTGHLANNGRKNRRLKNESNATHFVQCVQHLCVTCLYYVLTVRKVRVAWVLVEGVHPTIANGNSSYLNGGLFVEEICNGRDVVASERLTSQVKGKVSKLGVLFPESMNKDVKVVSDLILIVPKLFELVVE